MENLKKYANLLIVLVIALVAAGIYFLWVPAYSAYVKTSDVLKNKEGELERKTQYLTEIESRLNALDDYEEELAKINEAIPVYDFSEISLLDFVQKTCSQNGMILSSLDIVMNDSGPSISGSSVAGGSWKTKSLVLSASVSGSYLSFKNFLKEIYLNSRMVNVSSISFASAKGNIYDFDLELIANYYVWEQSASAFSAPVFNSDQN